MVSATLVAGSLALAGLTVPVREKLIWNRTASAPTGLYWVSQRPVERSDWVVVSARSEAAQWAESNGLVGKDWPLIKQVAGLSGDEICRDEETILVNGEAAAEALERDQRGRILPVWSGCRRLKEDEVFLLNQHPRSLDGRYFGPLSQSDLDGVAVLVLKSGN